jgi:hypothetical protein
VNTEQFEISTVIKQTRCERRFGLGNDTSDLHLLPRPEIFWRVAPANDGERPDGTAPHAALGNADMRRRNLCHRPGAIVIRAFVRRFNDAPAHRENAWLGADDGAEIIRPHDLRAQR